MKYFAILILLGNYFLVNAESYEGLFVFDSKIRQIGQKYPSGRIVKEATPVYWAHEHKIHWVRGWKGLSFVKNRYGNNWSDRVMQLDFFTYATFSSKMEKGVPLEIEKETLF